MLLVALRRKNASLLSVCPPLLAFAAPPAFGLLLLPAMALAAREPGQGGLWFLVSFAALLFSVSAYAFGRAAWAKQVACRRTGSVLRVVAQGVARELEAAAATLSVREARFGWQRPVTVHMVQLHAGAEEAPFTLYAGFTARGARRAAERVAAHLGLGAPQSD